MIGLSHGCTCLRTVTRHTLCRCGAHRVCVVWIYSCEGDVVWIEVRPAEGESELVISHNDGAEDVQHWPSAQDALGQQYALERRLIEHGWRLRALLRDVHQRKSVAGITLALN